LHSPASKDLGRAFNTLSTCTATGKSPYKRPVQVVAAAAGKQGQGKVEMGIRVDEMMQRAIAANNPRFGKTIPHRGPIRGKYGMVYFLAAQQVNNFVACSQGLFKHRVAKERNVFLVLSSASSFAPAKVFVLEPSTYLWKPDCDDRLCVAEEVNFFKSHAASYVFAPAFFSKISGMKELE
jgi:hypothetical protein